MTYKYIKINSIFAISFSRYLLFKADHRFAGRRPIIHFHTEGWVNFRITNTSVKPDTCG